MGDNVHFHELTSLKRDIIGSLRLPNLSLIEGDRIAFWSISLSISFSCLKQHGAETRQLHVILILSHSKGLIPQLTLLNGTSGSLRLPKRKRREGERTAFRSI